MLPLQNIRSMTERVQWSQRGNNDDIICGNWSRINCSVVVIATRGAELVYPELTAYAKIGSTIDHSGLVTNISHRNECPQLPIQAIIPAGVASSVGSTTQH